MSSEQIRQQANRLRSVPLEAVLRLWGGYPDRHDKQKWHSSRGTLSIRGAKFFNWNSATGGGGAIDLVIHLEGGCSFRQALQWLHTHFPEHRPLQAQPGPLPGCTLVLPPSDPMHLPRVRSYLVAQRALPPALIDSLIEAGSLYADHRANAVFLLRATNGVPVGAELRGSGPHPWRGMAAGSRKEHGFFSVPPCPAGLKEQRQPIVLCESAIDALSCHTLHPEHWCISTSGARPNPAWLPALIEHSPGRTIFCGFDADDTGHAMARAMTGFHPEVQRLCPPAKDWNALL